MAVERLDAGDPRDRKRFVALEQELVGAEPLHWAEPSSDLLKRLAGKAALSDGIELGLFAADGKARCAAVLNRRWQAEERAGEDAGSIGYFAAAPEADDDVAEMFAAAEEWLAERGVRRVIAPFNGSAFHGFGVLTDAFDESPIFPLPWQPSWYARQIEAAGYAKAYPLYLYEIDLGSDAYREAAERALANDAVRVRPIDKKRWNEELDTLCDLFNEGFAREWEMQRYRDEEFREVYGSLKNVLSARLMQFAEVDGRPVGFVTGFPDWTPLFRSFAGRFGPLQLFRFARSAKRPTPRVTLLSIALLPDQHGKRIGQTLAATYLRAAAELGHRSAVYCLVNEVNAASRGLAKSFGGRERLLYHCYDKRLD